VRVRERERATAAAGSRRLWRRLRQRSRGDAQLNLTVSRPWPEGFSKISERAALEVLSYKTAADPELQALLFFNDSDIRRRSFVRLLPERVSAISTGDFLHELEAAGRIQSADHILDEAAARGRNVEQQRQPTASEPAHTALRDQLTGRSLPPEPGSDRSR
jgi:hypothetical protein